MSQLTLRISMAVGMVLTSSLGMVARQSGSSAPADRPVTFSRDVAPVLFKHCTSCHRPGEVAPMSLLTYQEARPWARSIRDKVLDGSMPPWHADPAYGSFSNERKLTVEEKDVLVRWAGTGAIEGDKRELPPAPVYMTGWTIGTPDAVVSMPDAFAVPASGEVSYKYFEAPTNFIEDRWIQAMEIRPGDRAVVHHVLVYAREPNPTVREPAIRQVPSTLPSEPARPVQTPSTSPEQLQARQRAIARRGVLLATTAPGMNATVLDPGTAMLIKAGTVLSFQIHYTPNGTATSDRTSIGFVFARQPPTVEVHATAFTNARFAIPAGAPAHPVESAVTFLEDVTIYRIFPHTHVRGKRWDYRLVLPGGRIETVLSVPRYDFNWQTDYVFAKPLKAPKGAVLRAVAYYDNSAANPANPDPTVEVRWGDQTWEEMQYTGITYSVDRD